MDWDARYQYDGDSSAFGTPSEWNPKEKDGSAQVWRFGISTPTDGCAVGETEGLAASIHGGILKWEMAVQEWIQCEFGQLPGSRESNDYLDLWSTPMADKPDLQRGAKTTITRYRDHPVGGDDFLRILKLVETEEPPPVARRLLISAQRQSDLHDFRVAVIDAATASEIALTTFVSEYLVKQGLTSEDTETLLRGHQAINNRSKLATKFGFKLPSNFIENIATPRNKAVHAAHPLSEDEARAAIATAEGVVDQVYPRTFGLPRAPTETITITITQNPY